MKKLLAVLVCLLTILAPGAQTESFPTPAPDPGATQTPRDGAASGSMELNLDGENMRLLFDASPLYSMRQDGYVQASFYGQSGDRFYELYVIFPDGVQPGETFSSQSAAAGGDDESGILLYATGSDGMVISIATQSAEGAYPAGSSYLLTFSDVRQEGGALAVSGTLEASLTDVDAGFNPLSGVRALSASFSFTLSSGASGEIPEAPSAPSAAPTAPATLITPADAQKI